MIRCAGYFRSANSKQFAMEMTPSFLCRQMGHGGGGRGGCWGGGGEVIVFGAASGMSVLWRTIFIVYDCSDYFRACKDTATLGNVS